MNDIATSILSGIISFGIGFGASTLVGGESMIIELELLSYFLGWVSCGAVAGIAYAMYKYGQKGKEKKP